MKMADQRNLATLEKLAEAVSSGNLALLDEAFAPNVVDHDPAPDQGPGPAGYKRFFSEMRAAFPDLKVTVDRLVQNETDIAIAYTYHGTHPARMPASRPPDGGSPLAEWKLRGSRTARSSSGGAVPTNWVYF
jgi:predicted ester cyclase